MNKYFPDKNTKSFILCTGLPWTSGLHPLFHYHQHGASDIKLLDSQDHYDTLITSHEEVGNVVWDHLPTDFESGEESLVCAVVLPGIEAHPFHANLANDS